MNPTIEPQPSYKVGPLVLETHTREVRKGGSILPLSAIQMEVFLQLVERRGGVVLREEFRAWPRRKAEADRRHPVDAVISELRKVLPKEVLIERSWGRGYRLAKRVPVTEVAGTSVPRA